MLINRGGDRRSKAFKEARTKHTLETQAERATQIGVSRRYLQYADKLGREAPELLEAVFRGEIKLVQALKQLERESWMAAVKCSLARLEQNKAEIKAQFCALKSEDEK